MKKFLWPILLVSHLSYADFPLSQIESFNGSFVDPSGTAQAEYFSIPNYNIGENAEFAVERQAGIYILSTPYEDIILDTLPEAIYELENLKWTDLNLVSLPLEFSLDMQALDGEHKEGEVLVETLSLSCLHSGVEDEIQNELLDACFNNDMSLGIKKLNIVTSDRDLSFSKFSANVQDNKLSFRIKVKGFTVKGSGESYFEPGLIRIKISKAKAGIISVKGMLFDELEGIDSDNVKVNKPWIEISY